MSERSSNTELPSKVLTQSHAPDKLLSLLFDTASYIGNIEAVGGLDQAYKESLDNDFQTISGLLTDAVAKGITVEDANHLEITESPIRYVTCRM